MRDDLEMKKQYFRDSVYLKYENYKNKDIEMNIKLRKKNNKMNILSKVAVALLVGTLGIGAYAGASVKLDLEKMGLLRLSENYEDSSVIVDKTIDNEYCTVVLESMAGDNSYLVTEYKISLKEKALELGNVDADETIRDNLILNNEIYIDDKEINNVMSNVTRLSDTEYIYVQVINVMDVQNSNSNLKIKLNNLIFGNLGNVVPVDKTIKASINLKKEEKSEKIMKEMQLNNNTKMVIQEIANTKFETFIKVQKIAENITWKEYNENPFEYESFILTNEAEKQIGATIRNGDWNGRKYYIKENDTFKETDVISIKEEDYVKVEENFIILMEGNEGETINLNLAKSRIYNDRTNEEKEMYDIAQWYPLKAGEEKYSAKSGLGGTFEVNRIVIDDENITFFYNEEGILGDEWRIIIRDNNGQMNYIHPTKEERANVNSRENKITFTRSTNYSAGLNLHTINMDNIDNLEFTLLFGCVTERIGEPLEITIPKRNEETAKITNIVVE